MFPTSVRHGCGTIVIRKIIVKKRILVSLAGVMNIGYLADILLYLCE